MRRSLGTVVLGLSACGYPLTQSVIHRWGRRGAVVVESVCVGLAARDAAMIASGVPRRLRSVPALLLHLELGTGLVASLAGMERLLEPPAGDSTQTPSGNAFETVRRVAVATLFALHTVRFSIYLRPDQGRRPLPV